VEVDMSDFSDHKAVEDAEGRLESRSVARRERLARRERRRRLAPWLLCPLVIPMLGALALVALVHGGRTGARPSAAALAACVIVPALLAACVGRLHGRAAAVLWALIAAALVVALAAGVGFVALGLGP
jgi:hypothetical protein